MNNAKKILACLGIGLVVILVHNWGVYLLDDPGQAARAKALELGWDGGDIEVVGAGYSSEWVGWKSFLRFRSKSEPSHGEVLVQVNKSTLFHPWVLTEYVNGKK